MKNTILFGVAMSIGIFPCYAQPLGDYVTSPPNYNQAFKECVEEYAHLLRKVNPYDEEPAMYFKDGAAYTGCAKLDSPKDKQYFIHYFQNGFMEQQIGYFYNGLKSREFNAKNGKSHGLHAMYNPDGSPYIEEYYVEGKPEGTLRRWHDGKVLAREAKYVQGALVYDHYFDKQGRKIE